MLNSILNVFFKNIQTVVAAGVANAIKLGTIDGIERAKTDLSLNLEGPQEMDVPELELLNIEELTINLIDAE